MNREIKFRGFTNKGKIMLDLKRMTAFALDPNLPMTGLFIPFDDDIVLMQYTGLKDKNGKEIYEGDIMQQPVSMSYRFDNNGQVRYESDYGGFIVEGAYRKNQHHELLTCDVAIECEVIGNIYQNIEPLGGA